jgi:UDP-glucuronate 4-epimerase
MKKVFVTGAAGFIGFHLIKALLDRGDEVVGFDNFNDYYSPALKEARAEQLDCEIIKGDVTDQDLLMKLIENKGITHIVHLAAQAGVRYSLQSPKAYLSSNIDGFLNILEVVRKHRHIPLTYASSSSIYGHNTKIPFHEEDRTDDQASLYGVTKKSNELMAKCYRQLFNIKTTGLRFFTVYGPWGRPDMAYFSFTQKILNDEPIDIYHHGKAMRDFTYIDDIVSGTLQAIDQEAENEVYNLGNHEPVALLTFVETLEELLGKEAKKVFLPPQDGDVAKTYADISKAKKELNFYPKTPLKEGLKQFVAWYSQFYGANCFQKRRQPHAATKDSS